MGKDQVIRHKHLDRFEKAFQEDMANKMAKSMRAFGDEHVRPIRRTSTRNLDRLRDMQRQMILLEGRVTHLERPWYRRTWTWLVERLSWY